MCAQILARPCWVGGPAGRHHPSAAQTRPWGSWRMGEPPDDLPWARTLGLGRDSVADRRAAPVDLWGPRDSLCPPNTRNCLSYQPAVLLGWPKGLPSLSAGLTPSAACWSPLTQICNSRLLNIQEFSELMVKHSHQRRLNYVNQCFSTFCSLSPTKQPFQTFPSYFPTTLPIKI